MRRFRESGNLAIDLANTWDPYLADPERLPDVEAFGRFLREHGIDEIAGRPTLERCRLLRGKLLHVLTAPSASELVDRLNMLIGEVATGATFVRRADGQWGLELEQRPTRRLDERLANRATNELVCLVATVGPERIRTCAAGPCREVFVDASRNGLRAYCSRRCANRVNATRHRRRNAAAG